MNNELAQATEGIKSNPSLIVSLGIIAGTGATAGLAAYGQHKTEKYLATDEAKNLTKKEVLKRTWKNYIPAGASLAATAILIGINQHFTNQLAGQVATLTASLGVLAANKSKIEAAAREKLGDETVDEIKKIARFPEKKEPVDSEKNEVAEAKSSEVKAKRVQVKAFETGYGDELFIEDYTGMVFRSSRKAVEEGLAKYNRDLKGDGYATYNDLYHALGLHNDPSYADTKYGWEYGWFIDKEHPEDSACDPVEGIQFELTKPEYSERYGENVTYIDMPYDSPWSNIWDY